MANKRLGRPRGHSLAAVKEYIRAYWEEHHFSPSADEISAHLSVPRGGTTTYWLKQLEDEGWLEPRTPRIARNIVPVGIFLNRPVFPDDEEYVVIDQVATYLGREAAKKEKWITAHEHNSDHI